MALEVIFYKLSSGKEPVREFLRDLPKPDRAKAGALLRKLQETGSLVMPYAKYLGKGLWEIRFVGFSGAVRIFYILAKPACIVLLHAIFKKTNKTPKSDLDLAEERKRYVELWERNNER